jgi:HK97 family phage major capsid protein
LFDDFIGRSGASVEQRVNPNTTFGTGGEFVPPLWLVSSFANYKRPTRVAANRCVNMPLPPGIDVINVPKMTTGSQTSVQAAQGGAVASQDIVTSTVSASVRTLSGQEDISLQLLEQSPIAMDGVVFLDLQRDYDRTLDQQVLYGTGTNGQHLGVFSVSSQTVALNTLNSVYASQIPVSSTVFMDASTAATQFRGVVNGVNQIETLYFDAPSAIWVHPRRANSWAYAADSTNRPLFTKGAYGQFNQIGRNEDSPTPQGYAGELYGLPVIKNANIPTTANSFTGNALNLTGGTQDPVCIVDESQLWLWESPLKLRALPEVLSGTLQIRYQVYAYSAFMANRFPTAISVLAGAGLAAPGF